MNMRQILGVAVLASMVAFPVASDAQYRQDDRRAYPQNGRYQSEIHRLVVHAERQSNQFRAHVERGWDNRNDGRWGRDWDNDWSRGGRGRGDNVAPGGYGRNDPQGRYDGYQGRNDDYRRPHDERDWGRDSRYSRRLSPKAAVQKLDEALERLRIAVTRNRGRNDRYDRNDRYGDYRRDDRYDKNGRYDWGRDNYAGRNEVMEVVRAADNVDFYFGRGRNYNSSIEREWAHVKQDIEPIARYYGVRMFGRW